MSNSLFSTNILSDSHFKIHTQEKSTKSFPESLSLYKSIFDNLNNAVFIVDFNGIIEEVNQIACKKYGYTHDEFLIMSFFNTISNSCRNNFQHDFKRKCFQRLINNKYNADYQKRH